MKKLQACLLVLLGAVWVVPVGAEHIPSAEAGAVELHGRSAVLVDTRSFDGLLELSGRLGASDLELGYRALTVGGYYRPHRNLKVGLFYRLQAGARHDDDWIEVSGGWEWQDTRERIEQVLMVDVSPRVELGFLPGANWVGMLKGRYLINTFNREQSILLRPGLTYFLLVDRRPLFNFSFNYGLYFPLNFGTTLVYEQAPYLSALYHLGEHVKLELTGSYRSVVWSSSRDSLAVGDSYQVRSGSFGVGLGVLFVLRP